ncbi:MAG: hypothetical protein U9N43_09170 [Euryarchaeota archaeon]|nr:hypothetical protein [Euryarchaeota archaeon]
MMAVTAGRLRLVRTALTVTVLIFLTCAALVHTASALGPDDVGYWIDAGSATLYKGDTYTCGDYTIEFVDYEETIDPASTHYKMSGDRVLIRLKQGDLMLNESVLNATCANVSDTSDMVCDELIWEDEIKIEIYADPDEDPRSGDPVGWQDPCILIEVWVRAKPAISLEISASCEAYTPRDSEIRVTIDIENDGDALLKNVDVMIDPGELRLSSGDLTTHFGNLSEDDEKTCYARLRVPAWINDTEGQPFTISVNATGFDDEGVMYNESATTEILVLPRWDLKVAKTVSRYISMDQTVWVRIDLENTGVRDLDVRLNDTVPDGFELRDNETETPCWRFNITPSERLRFSYHIKPQRPGVFEIPGAIADFTMDGKNVSILSNSPAITVDGAYIIVNKTAYPGTVSLGGEVTVLLSITNTGNREAIVDLADAIPSGAELVSGNMTLHAVLGENETDRLEYVIRFLVPGNVTLDHPEIAVSSSDYSYMTTTGMLTVVVIGSLPEPTATHVNDSEFGARQDGSDATRGASVDAPLLELMLGVCMLGVVYLIGRFR